MSNNSTDLAAAISKPILARMAETDNGVKAHVSSESALLSAQLKEIQTAVNLLQKMMMKEPAKKTKAVASSDASTNAKTAETKGAETKGAETKSAEPKAKKTAPGEKQWFDAQYKEVLEFRQQFSSIDEEISKATTGKRTMSKDKDTCFNLLKLPEHKALLDAVHAKFEAYKAAKTPAKEPQKKD
jgi:hypothetical protein